MRHWTHLLVVSILLSLTSTLLAADSAATAAATPAAVTFDHLKDGPYKAYSISSAQYRPIVIQILNTYPAGFDYEITGIPIKAAEATGGVSMSQLTMKELTQVHDPKYGGYVVHITPKAGAITVTDAPAKQNVLDSATLVISVTTLQWDIAMAGAFTVSGLRDHVYSLQTRTVDGKSEQYVAEDTSKEDRSRLGTGAFIHVYHSALPWLGGTFGLGINDASRTTYFAGPSIRFGDKAALSFGVAAGSVNRLPGGISVGKTVTDGNVLSNLGNRINYNYFVAFSFSFLDARGFLEKPFAGASTPSDSSSSQAPPPGNPVKKPNTPVAVDPLAPAKTPVPPTP
jgi:hypothetical protein